MMREILAGLFVLALLFGWVQSCRLETAQTAMDRAALDLSHCRVDAGAMRRSLGDVDDQTAANLAEAAARTAAAQDAAARAEQAEQETAAKLSAANRALRDAMRDPGCADQLEVQLCAAIPLL